jgi:predicted ATPase
LVGELAKLETVPAERREVRRRAVRALRELLSQLAALQPTVLLVDDLQWGDADSALMLKDILDSPDSPPLLFVGCYRSEDCQSSPCRQTLLETQSSSEATTDRRQISVQPLSPEESRLLAAALLERGAGSPDSREADLSRESQGNPYFLVELARQLPPDASHAAEAAQTPLDLDGMLLRRVSLLPKAARELLNVVAVAGHPVRMEEACQAIRSMPDPRMAALLRSDHLIRTASGQPDEVETYHDRIRETINGHLSAADTRGYHARLATTLEASTEADPEILCVHFEAAGDNEKAGRYGLLAADRAADALAFDRAAELYRFVLGLGAFNPADEANLHRKLADALANAGRGAEAAEHYLIAAGQVGGIETVELKRLAGDQLLRTGRYREGRSLLTAALSAVGLKVPKSLRQAVLMILVNSLRLRLRGRRFRQREEAQIPREELVRIDTCLSAGSRLAMIEGLPGIACTVRYQLLAGKAGEPSRLAVALAQDALTSTMVAGRQTARHVRLFEAAEALAKRHKNLYCVGYIKAVRGEAVSFLGHWRQALQMCDEAEAFLRQHCTGVYWEISLLTLDIITSLFFLGEIKELSQRIPKILRETQQRNDLFAGVVPRTYFGNIVWLAADQPDEARRQATLAMAGWPREPFLLQHVFELIGCASIDLYASEGPRAGDRIARAWPDFKRSWHIKHRFPRVLLLHLRARAALASLGPGLNDRAPIRSAERDAKKILREPTGWSGPLARLVIAGIARACGKSKQAVEQLETAIREFDDWEMALYSAAAKRRLGELLGGQRGQELIAAGTELMTDQGIVRPDRMTQMLAPGFE